MDTGFNDQITCSVYTEKVGNQRHQSPFDLQSCHHVLSRHEPLHLNMQSQCLRSPRTWHPRHSLGVPDSECILHLYQTKATSKNNTSSYKKHDFKLKGKTSLPFHILAWRSSLPLTIRPDA